MMHSCNTATIGYADGAYLIIQPTTVSRHVIEDAAEEASIYIVMNAIVSEDADYDDGNIEFIIVNT